MLSQFKQQNQLEFWNAELETVTRIKKIAGEVFGLGWEAESVWEWLNYLAEDIPRLQNTDPNEKDRAFMLAIFQEIDTTFLKKMEGFLKRMSEIYLPPAVPGEIVDPTSLPADWLAALLNLQINQAGTELFWRRVARMPEAQKAALLSRVKVFADEYVDFRVPFSMIAATMLYHMPQEMIVKFMQFKDFMVAFKPAESPMDLKSWLVIFRFLGQSFFGNSSVAQQWAMNLLSKNPLGAQVYETQVDRIFSTLVVHLAYYNIADQGSDTQHIVLDNSIWRAFCLGVGVEKNVQDSLAGQVNLFDYLSFSIGLADELAESKEILYYQPLGSSDNVTLGKFITKYLTYAQKNDLDGLIQVQFVDTFVKEQVYPLEAKHYLLAILSLYLHLRECDLVDYRGMLSDEGAFERRNWSTLLQRDIEVEELEEIKRYFRLMQRPTRMKMELVVAFRRIPWDQEPYLNRVLALSNAYEEVYSPQYAPLVFFNELEGKWEINRDLPENWL